MSRQSSSEMSFSKPEVIKYLSLRDVPVKHVIFLKQVRGVMVTGTSVQPIVTCPQVVLRKARN